MLHWNCYALLEIDLQEQKKRSCPLQCLEEGLRQEDFVGFVWHQGRGSLSHRGCCDSRIRRATFDENRLHR